MHRNIGTPECADDPIMKYFEELLVAAMIRFFMGCLVVLPTGLKAESSTTAYILDEQGRQLVPGGFVVLENVPYTPDDYQRMVRMGANFQVIRMPVGHIGGWPGVAPDPDALKQFDSMVRMGKEAGMRTIFKLVVYGVRPFGEKQWNAIWRNTDGTQDKIMAAWRKIWIRYKDEPSVFGYDLLNEPQRGVDVNYERCQSKDLLPFLRRMTDSMHAISPEKWILYQPLLRNPEDQWNKGKNPVVAIDEPFGREQVIYAPHLYRMELPLIRAILDDFQRQAAISKAPLLLGEWGAPTRANTDGNPAEEARYTRVYQDTVHEMDTRGIGGIKAWFCGARTPIPVKGSTNWMTWAIFSDPSPAGKVERKYITDAVARPRPLVVAGRVRRYCTDFKVPSFEMIVKTDPSLGATEIYVPAERYFPEGFRIELGTDLVLALDPGASEYRTIHAVTSGAEEQAKLVRWDSKNQRVAIDKWTGDSKLINFRILHGALE